MRRAISLKKPLNPNSFNAFAIFPVHIRVHGRYAMGLTLKRVIRSTAGTFHYRRRVPKDVAAIIGKNEFKRFLGNTEREALKNYM